MKPVEHIFVSGIVAVRDGMPYVQIATEHGMMMQLSPAIARQIADDLLVQASRAEADAMLHKFFSKMEFPAGALGALMVEFRDFRAKIDDERVEHTHREPPTEGPKE